HGHAVAADGGELLVGLAEQLHAVVDDRSGDPGVLVEQAHDGQRRDGLAGTGLADDAEGLAGLQVESDATHGVDPAGLARETDLEVLDGQDGAHARPPAAEVGSRASRRPSATSAIETVSRVSAAAGK